MLTRRLLFVPCSEAGRAPRLPPAARERMLEQDVLEDGHRTDQMMVTLRAPR